jgi:hypothetical protein
MAVSSPVTTGSDGPAASGQRRWSQDLAKPVVVLDAFRRHLKR